MDKFYIGVDIGSVSINVAVLSEGKDILRDWYVRTEGKPIEKAYSVLKEVLETYPVVGMSATGRGGKLLSEILDIPFVNEVIAQAKATGCLYPEVRTIIEIGGEDSKFINIEHDSGIDLHVVRDFAMNTICAAGTGSFLDQQAARLELNIEEFGELGLRSKNPPRIAGRCSVFANTDMIHLQQEATPAEDIVAGLCFALVRNYKSVIAKGKKFVKPVAFQGGVAYNKGMVRAFRETLGLREDELIVPKYVASMGAIGCVLAEMENGEWKMENGRIIERIPEFLANQEEKYKPLKPLREVRNEKQEVRSEKREARTGQRIPVWMGIDVGSISTNVVLIDSEKGLVARRYLWTSGKPIDAVMRGIREISEEVGSFVEVKGVGTTGSGRYMIGDLVGADIVKNEITSQARASIEIDPDVDTIFEIGGQDSKYISLRDGVICDFEMNKVCAAGTGSFLEEQAERLDLNIKEEFAECAFTGKLPIDLGERCTVFMQSNLTAWQQRGGKKENLAAGLAYSIAHNYLNRVVGNKRIGDNIFFQGAVAHNRAIVSAFRELLGKPIKVPPNNDVTGAIGVATIAMEYMNEKSKFKGFDLCEREYNIEMFECNGCPNTCEIKKVMLEGEDPLYYGSRCEKYEKKAQSTSRKSKVDLFGIREKMLLKSYDRQPTTENRQPRIGIPRALIFHEYLPFWVTFFQELGYTVVLSDSTNKKIIHRGVESCISDHCFPIKSCHGHILNLIDKGVEYIFLPSLINMQKEYPEIRESYACPYIQAVPYVIKAALDLKSVTLIAPVLYLKRGEKYLERVLIQVGNKLRRGRLKVLRAFNLARLAQKEFHSSIKAKGAEVLREIREPAIVIVGRPYNTCDAMLNLDIPKILSELGVNAIPMDLLPVEEVNIGEDWPNMYWRYGQRILAASKIIREHPNLYGLYITNFGCGVDSFVQRYFECEMGKKPCLIIEVDEHSAHAGIITRCEAFLDSIESRKGEGKEERREKRGIERKDALPCFRTLLIPFMGNHSYVFAAAFRHYGVDAKVIPVADAESVKLGRKYTTGKECFPCIIMTGDMIKVLSSGEFDRKNVAFFMPGASGPCRFGQYNKLQRLILRDAGYEDVPIVSPNQAKDFYKTLQKYGRGFDKKAWWGLCAVDILDKLARSTRPYEMNKGETDRVYKKCLDLICEEVEGDGNMIDIMRSVREEFEAISIKREPKPLIGITGEIYVRNHHFSNDNIVRAIEEIGGEVILSSTAEWLFYVNFRRKEDSLLDKNYKELIMHWIKDLWQYRTEHRIGKEFEGLVRYLEEPTTKELFSYSNPYLHRTVEGEAVLTVGKCIDFINKKADGIVTVMPFTCMPGTNVAAVMESVVKERYGIPYLNIAYDGLEQSTTRIRLETFMHQAYQYKKSKSNPSRHGL